jgi:hypothetical protein
VADEWAQLLLRYGPAGGKPVVTSCGHGLVLVVSRSRFCFIVRLPLKIDLICHLTILSCPTFATLCLPDSIKGCPTAKASFLAIHHNGCACFRLMRTSSRHQCDRKDDELFHKVRDQYRCKKVIYAFLPCSSDVDKLRTNAARISPDERVQSIPSETIQ